MIESLIRASQSRELRLEILRFGLVGVVTNIVYFAVLFVATRPTGVSLGLAAAIAYTFSLCVNYLLQRSLTFRSQRSHLQAGPLYLAGQLVALGLNSLILTLMVTVQGWHFVWGQGVALLVTTTWNYVCQKLLVFRNV